MLKVFRHSRYRLLVTMLLLVAQGALFAADSWQVNPSNDVADLAHHLQLADDSDTTSIQAPADLPSHDETRCDSCCACHGHSSHLAFLTETFLTNLTGQAFYQPIYQLPFTSLSISTVYRPPIV